MGEDKEIFVLLYFCFNFSLISRQKKAKIIKREPGWGASWFNAEWV
jgi:hypothetical protein